MQKRQFLGRLGLAGLSGAALPASALAAAKPAGPALLTLTGAIGKPNRGRFDPLRDQMMHKQKLSFERAHAFDFATLAALPALTIAPTLEYDGKVHTLRGPRLLDVLQAAGVAPRDGGRLVLRAVDGYAVTLSQAQARAQGFIVATHLDGQTMALGGLGPLWAIYDADRVAEMAAKALPERFGSCPWALYHIDVLD
ncbi:molybdopterin-dependent oxidoreductase [Rugamonas sp. CCM 8940]|uniref:molybdopterin-dependent oxidoreductase n=1 Tax=Rugamonas sp. CCM 8940 TaxID=2765359 RepID=UPI0018F3FB21|nr:molybdopterin-dependent oxidoreductase [Rugamonas sp. CCM 8940]MBJ7309411.1 molybdopterin-dependent oxidoreductase [Rugamonas sp. CCM 8940]